MDDRVSSGRRLRPTLDEKKESSQQGDSSAGESDQHARLPDRSALSDENEAISVFASELSKPCLADENDIGLSQVAPSIDIAEFVRLKAEGFSAEQIGEKFGLNLKQVEPEGPKEVSPDTFEAISKKYPIVFIEEIGRGGAAVVYRIEDLDSAGSTEKLQSLNLSPQAGSLQSENALKILRPNSSNAAQKRFSLEISSFESGLEHTNIVSPLRTGEVEGHKFYTMPLMKGGSLSSAMDRIDSDPDFRKQALEGMLGVLDALHYLHTEQNIVHRDIKPDNLLLPQAFHNAGEPLDIRIADLGAIKKVGGSDDLGTALQGARLKNVDLTSDGVVVGTPRYISPERLRGENKADPLSDQYSVGVVLYHMVTGAYPHKGQSRAEIMQDAVFSDLIPVHERAPEVPAALSRVIERMLAREPHYRYATSKEARIALEAAIRLDG